MIERYNQKVRKPSFNLTFHSMKVQASGSIMPTSDVRNEGGETGGSGLGAREPRSLRWSLPRAM